MILGETENDKNGACQLEPKNRLFRPVELLRRKSTICRPFVVGVFNLAVKGRPFVATLDDLSSSVLAIFTKWLNIISKVCNSTYTPP